MNSITIYYPVSFESHEVLVEVQKYGKVFPVADNQDTKELNSTLTRTELEELEKFLVKNEVPYDLLEHSKGANLPRMKKVRPEFGFEKEIESTFYQNGEAENLEEGVMAVSALLSIIEQSDKDKLANNLLEEIKKATFQFDNVENIFLM